MFFELCVEKVLKKNEANSGLFSQRGAERSLVLRRGQGRAVREQGAKALGGNTALLSTIFIKKKKNPKYS